MHATWGDFTSRVHMMKDEEDICLEELEEGAIRRGILCISLERGTQELLLVFVEEKYGVMVWRAS